MGLVSMFKTPRPHQFNYQPVFYDARKEALKEREQQIRQELGLVGESEPRVSGVKGRMRGYYARSVRGKSQSNIRLVIILAILLLLAYFFFYY